MSVLSGGLMEIKARHRGDAEGDHDTWLRDSGKATDTLLQELRENPEVLGVEVHAVHYIVGAYQDALSWGSMYEDDEDEDGWDD